MSNNEPKVRTRTRTRRDGVTVTKTLEKGRLSDGGKYRTKTVNKTGDNKDFFKTKGTIKYGESTKKALGVTARGSAKVKYENRGSVNSWGTSASSGYKSKRLKPGEKTYKKSESALTFNEPEDIVNTKRGDVKIPAHTTSYSYKLEKTKNNKGTKKRIVTLDSGGYDYDTGKPLKDRVKKINKKRRW